MRARQPNPLRVIAFAHACGHRMSFSEPKIASSSSQHRAKYTKTHKPQDTQAQWQCRARYVFWCARTKKSWTQSSAGRSIKMNAWLCTVKTGQQDSIKTTHLMHAEWTFWAPFICYIVYLVYSADNAGNIWITCASVVRISGVRNNLYAQFNRNGVC